MQRTKSVKPLESPADTNPVSRLLDVLEQEGFSAVTDDALEGERVYRRTEKVLFAGGETVFIFIDYPQVTHKILAQAMEGLTNLFRARGAQRMFSVLQTTTVYVVFTARSDSPHNDSLSRYITSTGGAVLIPVIIVPEINQVVYPAVEEKVGTVRPRIEYLQYLLNERRDPVNLHQQTIKTFYVSLGVVGLLIVAIILGVLA